jgi:iron(III) transport system substrate-binding protein
MAASPQCLPQHKICLLALAALGSVAVLPAVAAPPPSPVTPELIAAAKADGRVVFYASMDIQVAEGIGKAFEAKYPGIVVQVERAGAERLLQRVAQEYAAGIHMVDVIDSTDAAHPLYWKQQGWLAPFVPEGVARLPDNARDADGFYAVDRATMAVVAYNTRLVTPTEAPKSYADLLDPKWTGKIIKANPAYAGNTLTATLILSRSLGWDYFQKLGKQRVMQVQSATEPPKKLALGERSVMFDGSEYVALSAKAHGEPLEVVYMPEGTPLVFGSAAVMKDAPHGNAARLFISFLFSREGQNYFVEKGYFRSLDAEVSAPAGQPPLAGIKTLTADPAEIEKSAEDVKRRYAEYFGI